MTRFFKAGSQLLITYKQIGGGPLWGDATSTPIDISRLNKRVHLDFEGARAVVEEERALVEGARAVVEEDLRKRKTGV